MGFRRSHVYDLAESIFAGSMSLSSPPPIRLGNTELSLVVLALVLTHVAGMAAFLTVPVLAPGIGPELGLRMSLAGVYTALCYLGYMFTGPFTGGLVARFGAVRTCQMSLGGIALGLVLAAQAGVWGLALSAVVAGLGHGPLTATGSHILSLVAPERRRSFLFGLKQTGTPLGAVLIGALCPWLMLQVGWRPTLVAMAVIVLAVALAMQPLRRRFDAAADPDRAITLRSAVTAMRLFRDDPRLRALTLAAMGFGCSQFCFSAFFVVFQVEALGIDHVDAGINLGIAQAAGAACRVIWGLIADQTQPRRVLVAIGLGTAVSALLLSQADAGWAGPAITAAGMLVGGTAIGWNGVLLAETARVAGHRAGEATGMLGTLFAVAMVFAPTIFSALVQLTGSYASGFMACAAAAALGAVVLARAPGLRHPRGSLTAAAD
jgi:MFS family permease